MKETMWKKHLALLTSTALTLQLMAFGTVSSLAVTDGDTLTDGIVQTETLTPEEEFSETGTEIHADYLTKVEYDTSPMQVGETRAIRFYHPETLKGGKGSIHEVSDNLSYTYEEGSDTIYITALAEGDAKMYVMAEGCAFGAYVRLTVEAGTETPMPGDLDGDNIVNTTDAALLLTAAAQSGAGEQRSIAQTAAADLNGDGAGDAADAALILQYAAYAGTGGTLSVMDFLKDLLT